MVIKKFVAETMNEALIQVRKELGEDAVILKTRKIEKGGIFNFKTKEMVEVTAATPDYTAPPIDNRKKDFSREQKEVLDRLIERPEKSTIGSPGGLPRDGSDFLSPKKPEVLLKNKLKETYESTSPIRNKDDLIKDLKNKEKRISEITNNNSGRALKDVQTELSELRTTVQQIATHLKYDRAPALPEELLEKWRDLVNNGVSERIATDITQKIQIELSGGELERPDLIEKKLMMEVSGRLRTRKLDVKSFGNRTISIALIGPTGVGKTTTLAKMATNRKIFGGLSIGLISTDTYRVAAVEQLKTFAAIAGIPVEVVYRPEELDKAMDKFADKDVILIDTAGRSQNDTVALSELSEFMDVGQPDEVIMTLSAGTRLEDQVEMVKRFSIIPTTRLILTKLDEITSAGHLLELADLLPREWTYLTTGQNVPDDIVAADARKLSEMIIKKENFKKYRQGGFLVPS